MKHVLLVTGNQHKLTEWQSILPATISMDVADIDLAEIQSDDPIEIVTDKARRAYDVVGKPVVVEDVEAGLDELHGLPGPFIKFFIQKLGPDALYQLAGHSEGGATVSCSVAYYDGKEMLTVQGVVHGTVVAPRGKTDFGFDATFVPDGESLTYAEMDQEQKNSLSHRRKAIELLIAKLNTA